MPVHLPTFTKSFTPGRATLNEKRETTPHILSIYHNFSSIYILSHESGSQDSISGNICFSLDPYCYNQTLIAIMYKQTKLSHVIKNFLPTFLTRISELSRPQRQSRANRTITVQRSTHCHSLSRSHSHRIVCPPGTYACL